MGTQLILLDRQIQHVETLLLDRAAVIENQNDFLTFYFAYVSNYVPLLEFAVESLPEESIARLANFSMLIDNICSVHTSRLTAIQLDSDAKEIAERTSRPKTEVLRFLDDISIAQKVQIASTLLLANSLSRDLTLCAANSKFNAINKSIAWSNIFGHFFDFPALIDSFIDKEMISEAERDLDAARKRFQKRDREYDYDLAGKWAESLDLPRQFIQEKPKFFVGPKLTWLQAMEGLELAKCLVLKDVDAGKRALLYNEKILSFLVSDTISDNEWSYRNMNSGGPTCDLNQIVRFLSRGQCSIRPVDNFTLFVTSQDFQFFLLLPSSFSFYVSPKMHRVLSPDHSIPMLLDIPTIIAFHRDPAGFVANFLQKLCKPSESLLYHFAQQRRQKLQRIVSDTDSIITKLSVTYGESLNVPIAKAIERLSITSLHGITVYGALFSVESLAKAVGLPTEAALWSDTRLAIASVFVSALDSLATTTPQVSQEKDRQLRKSAKTNIIPETAEDRIRLLQEKMQQSEEEMRATFDELKDTGLVQFLEAARMIRSIILSGLSTEEILERLKQYCESFTLTRGGSVSSANGS